MSKYLIKLTPHDKFFFGGETTFGEGNVNYFVKSNYFPQQTSLLGLIRYQLMVQNRKGIFEKNKITNTTEAANLINHKSFEITDTEFSFGKIKELSPVFIAGNNEEFLFPANKEYQWVGKENDKGVTNFILRQFAKENGRSSIYTEKDFIPYLDGYIAKDGLPDILVNKDLSIKKYYDYDGDKAKNNNPENGIFIEHKQVGIRKNYKGKTEDKAFYVQSFFKLKKGYSFAFILKLDDGIIFSTNELVNLGGEQSKFRMDVENFEREFEDILPQYEGSKESNKVVLVSDAYVSNKIFDDCDFAVTDTIDFRTIKSTVRTTKYSSMDRTGEKEDELSKSGKYNFFKKGSVFYGEDISKIKKHFDIKVTLKKIGYNHYKEIINK